MKSILYTLVFALLLLGCRSGEKKAEEKQEVAASAWETDFFDDFETFNTENWQDQRIWVNNELQCYVPDGEYGTREVSDGSLLVK